MATVVSFTVPAEAFPLGTVCQAYPHVTVELDRLIPTSNAIIPYARVHGGASDEAATLDDHPEILSATIVDHVDSDCLLRIDWDPTAEGLVKAFSTLDLSLLSAEGDATEWEFEVRADDRETLTEFQRYCEEHDIPMTFSSIDQQVPVETSVPELTDAQREALLAAYNAGYFDTPRETTLEEVGEQLGISRQAVADRLRRGHRALVGRLAADSHQEIRDGDR
jgi:predicted DNA binding protein